MHNGNWFLIPFLIKSIVSEGRLSPKILRRLCEPACRLPAVWRRWPKAVCPPLAGVAEGRGWKNSSRLPTNRAVR